MTALTDFLLARIAEDEEAARACVGVNDLARHLNGAPIPRWVREGSGIRSDDEYRILRVSHTWRNEADHITRHDPARVLADCVAHRRFVERVLVFENALQDYPGLIRVEAARNALIMALRVLSTPYADHPDYEQEWTP